MYGLPRQGKMTRLKQEAKRGDTDIFVEPGLDLKEGDRIVLTATSYVFDASDDVFVTAYNN